MMMIGVFLINQFYELKQRIYNAQPQFLRHFGLQQAVHHLNRDEQGIGRDILAGIKPKVVHQHLAEFLGDEGMVREGMMIFSDTFLGAFVDAEVFG